MPIGPGTTGYITQKNRDWDVTNDHLPVSYHALTKKNYNPNLVRTKGVASTALDPV